MASHKNLIAIHFSAYVLTNYGQTVFVLGNCLQLGQWNSSKGLQLQTNAKQYPIWFSNSPMVLEKPTTVQFKLVVKSGDGNIVRWENLRENRVIYLNSSCSLFITEGQTQTEFEEVQQNSISTRMNSAKKGSLCEIAEELEEDDDFNKENMPNQSNDQDRKRSGSYGRSHEYEQILPLKHRSARYLEQKTQRKRQKGWK